MAVTYVGGSSYVSQNSEQFASVSIPGTSQTGDIGLLMVAGQNTGTHAISGWTQVGTTQDDNTGRFTVWRRTLSGAGGAVTIDSGLTQRLAIVLAVYRGVNTSSNGGVSGFGFTAETGTDMTHDSPSVTVTTSSVAVALYGERTTNPSTSFTPPASHTLRQGAYGQQTVGTPSAGLADNLIPHSSSVGGGIWTGDAAVTNAVAATIALEVGASIAVGPMIKISGSYIRSGEHKVKVGGVYV